MQDFKFDELFLRCIIDRGRGEKADVSGAVRRARQGHELPLEDIATLWYARELDTQAIYRLALEVRRNRPIELETFAPLYLTNTCDAMCLMCGMRRDNEALERDTADPSRIEEQLRILVRRGMHGVALVTGEYRSSRRLWAMAY